MKLLVVADVPIHRLDGGASRVLHEETTRLAARGHAVRLLTRQVDPAWPEAECIDGVRVHHYRPDQTHAAAFLFSTLIRARALFDRLLAEEPVDLIHLHQPLSAAGVLRSPRSRSIPTLYTCHSLAFEEYDTREPDANPILAALHSWGRKRLERNAIEQSRRVTTLSEFMRQRVHARHGAPLERIDVIPGGVNEMRFRPAPDKPSVRAKLGLPAGRFMLFTVRNLVPRMGLDNLILAMRRVVRGAPGALLVIGGTGRLRGRLESLVEEHHLNEHVRFTGFISEDELPLYYQAADLFVLPTVQLEGFGLVTVEALASGLPVVGTRIGGTPEILEALDPGLLFASPDPAALAGLIVDKYRLWAPQPEQYAEMSRRCRRHVEAHFTWQRHVERLESLYDRLLSESGRHRRG
ncbi:MAG: glycosyltransferase family 4 protein [Nitrospirae bacterium]|nr:glycosyltransferase family 4 protein [Nitrospirota bacterium]